MDKSLQVTYVTRYPLSYEYKDISTAKPILHQRLMTLSALDTGSSHISIEVFGCMLLIMPTQDLKAPAMQAPYFLILAVILMEIMEFIILTDGQNISENEALLLFDYGIASGNVLKSLSFDALNTSSTQ
uniref:Uncharacterized protein n=1 Tax=Glossina pallidipes TaxID=7398 RepID=A0A1B0AI76_GLOPL